MIRLCRVFPIVLAVLCWAACGNNQVSNRDGQRSDFRDSSSVESGAAESSHAKASTTASTPSGNSTAAHSPSGFGGKVKFKGATAFSIKPMDDGAKLVDAAEKEIARYNIKDALRVKVKDASDRELGQIKGDAAKIHIEAPGGVRQFALQRQDDGDYKLETAAGELLRKIKKRDYGWKIEDAAGVELAKVKTKSGKTSLRDAKDVALLTTNDPISPLAMACLALEVIEQPLRVALAIRMQAEGK
jgi:hypothetical protein